MRSVEQPWRGVFGQHVIGETPLAQHQVVYPQVNRRILPAILLGKAVDDVLYVQLPPHRVARQGDVEAEQLDGVDAHLAVEQRQQVHRHRQAVDIGQHPPLAVAHRHVVEDDTVDGRDVDAGYAHGRAYQPRQLLGRHVADAVLHGWSPEQDIERHVDDHADHQQRQDYVPYLFDMPVSSFFSFALAGQTAAHGVAGAVHGVFHQWFRCPPRHVSLPAPQGALLVRLTMLVSAINNAC